MWKHLETSMRMLIGILALSSLLAIPFAQAANAPAKPAPQHPKVTRQDAPKTPAPLDLKLHPKDVETLIAKYQIRLNDVRDSQLEEVVVSSTTELLPMRSAVDDAWGGLFAPLWAALNPTQSWRIFLPIPAK